MALFLLHLASLRRLQLCERASYQMYMHGKFPAHINFQTLDFDTIHNMHDGMKGITGRDHDKCSNIPIIIILYYYTPRL